MAGWTTLNTEIRETAKRGVLGELEHYRTDTDALEAGLRTSVARARDVGATWDEIGAALGISKQLAAYRYGRRS